MVTVGVMYLPLGVIASRIIAQTGKLEYQLTDGEIRRIQLSEQAEMLYQGASRGNSRRTIDGSAGHQTIYLFHSAKDAEHVVPILREAMPGLKVEAYELKHIKRRTGRIGHLTEEVSGRIGELLEGAGGDVQRFATTDLVKECGCGLKANDRAWRSGLDRALDRSVEWKKDGRGIVRRAKQEP
jgi:hypothetical protein